jgi:radical SAM protein with 4Fe4S-binding SPASM domain
MGKITGFMEYQRLEEAAEAPQSRKQHWREFVVHLTDEQAAVQGARCMDCGIPFCNSGCPVNNMEGRARCPAQHQQLSRVHRPRVSGAVRGGLHAEYR